MTTKSTKPTSTGTNRTGIATSPLESQATIEGAERATPFVGIDGEAIAAERLAWAASADPVGTMPPPASVKGAVKTGIEMIQGHKANVFLDKLGARAAFERSGTRLYEALLVKFDAASVHEGGPTREELEHLRDEELQHYAIARDAIVSLGGDPTVMTPCADVLGVLGMGLVQVLTDPRTTLSQCLDAMLTAELTDNDAWQLLVDLAEGLGHDDLAAQFRIALQQEEQHLVLVRGWVEGALLGQAGVSLPLWAAPPE
jgi:rubrerythrin